jgi:hypothetical protein
MEHVFSGVFDGNDKIVHQMRIARIVEYAGLFSWIENGVARNVYLKDIELAFGSTCGGIAAYTAGKSIISKCTLTGKIATRSSAGGITSKMTEGTEISNCNVTVKIYYQFFFDMYRMDEMKRIKSFGAYL